MMESRACLTSNALLQGASSRRRLVHREGGEEIWVRWCRAPAAGRLVDHGCRSLVTAVNGVPMVTTSRHGTNAANRENSKSAKSSWSFTLPGPSSARLVGSRPLENYGRLRVAPFAKHLLDFCDIQFFVANHLTGKLFERDAASFGQR
jgi:hypothetical protein